MKETRWSVLYAGLDINTFFVLNNEKDFDVCAIAYIDKFKIFSLNPINYLFKVVYFLRVKEKMFWLEFMLNKLWLIFMPLSSGVFYQYRNFLYALSAKKIEVVDLWEEEKTINYIKKRNIDFILLSVWPLLSGSIVLAPKYGSINIHPSMLPQYRGSLPTLWSLKNHDKESAVTYMIVDPTMDTGNIVAQHAFSISENDNWLDIENTVAKVVENTLVQDVKNYLLGILKTHSQNENVASSKTDTYEKYRKINFETETVRDIYNKINLYPHLDPGVYCYSNWHNKKVFFKRTKLPQETNTKKIVSLNSGDFISSFWMLSVKSTNGVFYFRLFKDIDIASSIKFLFVKFGHFV